MVPSVIALVPQEEHSISELAEEIAKVYGVKEVVYDTTKADGQYKKTMGNDRLKKLLPGFTFTSLTEGLTATIDHYIKTTNS